MKSRVPARQGARGFSRFEFAVTAALFATLVGMAANRINLYQQQAESVAAEQLIASLRVALQIRVAHLTAQHRQHQVLTIADENPIDWLSERPKNYLGEYYFPDHKNLTTGSWYFDRGQKTLVYLLSHQNGFASGSSILLKFKVKSVHLPMKPARPNESGTIESVALVQVYDQQMVDVQ